MDGNIAAEELFESQEEMMMGEEGMRRMVMGMRWIYPYFIKCAMDLKIPHMILTKRTPLSLAEIAAELPTESPDTDLLFRVLRFLVNANFFTVQNPNVSEDGSPVTIRYGLTPLSKWMAFENGESLDYVEAEPRGPMHRLKDRVLGNKSAAPSFEGYYDESENFKKRMARNSYVTVTGLISSSYRGFDNLTSLVDVGGGTGTALSLIIKAYPNITRAINFDLAYALSSAPSYPGIEHVAGDMFRSIPKADAVFLKWILHNWSDKDCIRILKNCIKAIPKDGKVFIMEMILEDDIIKGEGKQSMEPRVPSLEVILDGIMTSFFDGGKERNKGEWKRILIDSGFSTFNFIRIPSSLWLIEAFP